MSSLLKYSRAVIAFHVGIRLLQVLHVYICSLLQSYQSAGGDQLTVERQCGCQKQHMDGDTVGERIEELEPVIEDWHGIVSFLGVSKT